MSYLFFFLNSPVFTSSALNFEIYKYLFIFLAAMVEGSATMAAAGFFCRLGYLHFWPAYFILIVGDLIADCGWYFFGYFGAGRAVEKYGHFLNLTPAVMDKISFHFHKHQNKILFLSKITMGLGFSLVTLITAGIVRIPFKKFVFLNLIGEFIWVGFLMNLGYFLGNAYFLVAKELRILFIIAVAIILSLALYGFNKFMRKKFL